MQLKLSPPGLACSESSVPVLTSAEPKEYHVNPATDVQPKDCIVSVVESAGKHAAVSQDAMLREVRT